MTKAAELFEHRHDDDEWDDEPADVRVRPSTTEVVSFRLASDELDRLQSAARERGVSLSELIRGAIQRDLGGGAASALGDVYIGATRAILGIEWRSVSRPSVGWSLLVRSSAGVRPIPTVFQVVPDFPPTSQNVTSSEGAERLDRQQRLPL